MYYTEEQIEKVRSGSDIVQIIGRYVNLKRSGSGYVGLCPFHSEKTPSFSVMELLSFATFFSVTASVVPAIRTW